MATGPLSAVRCHMMCAAIGWLLRLDLAQTTLNMLVGGMQSSKVCQARQWRFWPQPEGKGVTTMPLSGVAQIRRGGIRCAAASSTTAPTVCICE